MARLGPAGAVVLSRAVRRVLSALPPAGGPGAPPPPSARPTPARLAALRRRGLVEPMDAAGTAWRRTAKGEAVASGGP